MKYISRFLTAIILAACVSGCGTLFGKPKFSGFLPDYEGLTPVAGHAGAFAWVSDFGLKDFSYNAVIIDPVEVFRAEKDERINIPARELNGLDEIFIRLLSDEMGKQVKVTDRVSERVMRLTVGITEVVPVSPGHPLLPGDLAHATLEAQLTDARSERELMRFVIRKQEGPIIVSPEEYGTPAYAEEAFTYWAKFIGDRFKEAREV